jgi:hypothetical protein
MENVVASDEDAAYARACDWIDKWLRDTAAQIIIRLTASVPESSALLPAVVPRLPRLIDHRRRQQLRRIELADREAIGHIVTGDTIGFVRSGYETSVARKRRRGVGDADRRRRVCHLKWCCSRRPCRPALPDLSNHHRPLTAASTARHRLRWAMRAKGTGRTRPGRRDVWVSGPRARRLWRGHRLSALKRPFEVDSFQSS